MKLPSFLKKSSGFTLIELLVVIVVLGILVGVVIIVVNPNVQQEKAKEGVLKGNVDKIAQAMLACASTNVDFISSCDTFAKIGVIDPSGSPEGSVFQIDTSLNGDIQTQGAYTRSDGTICGFMITLVGTTYNTERQSTDCHTTW